MVSGLYSKLQVIMFALSSFIIKFLWYCSCRPYCNNLCYWGPRIHRLHPLKMESEIPGLDTKLYPVVKNLVRELCVLLSPPLCCHLLPMSQRGNTCSGKILLSVFIRVIRCVDRALLLSRYLGSTSHFCSMNRQSFKEIQLPRRIEDS